MVFVKEELIYISGAIGVFEVGRVRTDKKTFLPSEEQFRIFPGLLQVKPETLVKYSRSGCSFESGNSLYGLSS